MSNLVARFAESVFWLARYMERVENIARILDVNETFARDSMGGKDWLPILQLNADEKRFFARHEKATPEDILHFYILDRENPTSVAYGVAAARENARGLRHLISTEMWTHLNVFQYYVRSLKRRDIRVSNLSRLCGIVRENCQTHAGITEGTLYRDEAWCFYYIGKYIERADQTSRLLDIKYQHLVGPGADPDAALDINQWNAVIRSAAGYQAFRRTYQRGFKVENVAAFMIFDPDFPRSMSACLYRVQTLIGQLDTRFGLPTGKVTRGVLADVAKVLDAKDTRAVLKPSLHRFIDNVQMQLAGITDEMTKTFFARVPVPPDKS